MRNVDNQLVSIIVPVFNAEPYLAQCLDSILAQTHRELEVICLNDGSTDGSLAIMQAYAARDERIRVIAEDIFEHHEQHVHPQGKDIYTALFAVDSIKTLGKYYDAFKELN